MTLREPLRRLVGDRTAKVLASGLDLHTVEDLLRHYPRRYATRGELTDLASLQLDEHVSVVAEVRKVTLVPFRQRRGNRLEVVVTDGTGTLTLTFFNQAWRQKELRVGTRAVFSGKVGVFAGRRQLSHPDYEVLPEDAAAGADAAVARADELIPLYPATAGLTSSQVGRCVALALDTLAPEDVPDPLPADLRERHGLPALLEALRLVHRPATRAEAASATGRLRWEEAFVLQVVLAQRRALARSLDATPRRARVGGLLETFDTALPFTLTEGQRQVGAVIGADLARAHPMNRLLQGEVGSGKTVIAVRAMLAVVDAGGQAAMLAPTEVLAQQHHRSLTALLGPIAQGGQLGGAEHGTRVTLLTGSQPTAVRRRVLLDIASGDAGIVVGTHALIQETVDFFDLGLVVVDEQHRFGVEQRDALRAKAARPPHVLVMTATPIPRTVAMTVFGDLEVSTLTELPQGRSPVTTHVVHVTERPTHLDRAWQRVREEVAQGRQVFVVCPRIGDDGTAGADAEQAPGAAAAGPVDEERRPPLAVLDVAPVLAAGPLAGLRLGVLHGQLPPETKEEVMGRFTGGEVDVLVATTVVEVGVDVPNATVMIVLDADRFGVSQLHQLRGRVGRGSAPALCLLVTDLPTGSPPAERLAAVASTLDGFELSRIDLEARREGDVLGASQSGRRSSLRLLRVLRDADVIVAAREEASALVGSDPTLAHAPALRQVLAELMEEERSHYLDKA